MIRPEQFAYIDVDGETDQLVHALPAAGHLGVIEERCNWWHGDDVMCVAPCPRCKASL